MPNEENINIVKELYAAFGRGDIEGILNMLSEDVEWNSPGPEGILPTAGVHRGRDGVAKYFSQLGQAADIEAFEPQEFIANDNTVVATSQVRARLFGPNRTINYELVHIFTIRDGKIQRFREHFDTALSVEIFTSSNATTSEG